MLRADGEHSQCCMFFTGPAGGISSKLSSMRWMSPRYAKDDQLELSPLRVLLSSTAATFSAAPAPADPVAGPVDVSRRSGRARCPCVLEYMAVSSASFSARCTNGP